MQIIANYWSFSALLEIANYGPSLARKEKQYKMQVESVNSAKDQAN